MTIILVPLDGSRLAEEVLPHVEDLARRIQASIHFIEVIEPPTRLTGSPALDTSGAVRAATLGEEERHRSAAEEYLSRISEEWKSKKIETTWEVVEGRAATKIVEAAQERHCYLIAMSTHGRSGLGQLVYGSVANEVVREGGLPVLILKPTGNAAPVTG